MRKQLVLQLPGQWFEANKESENIEDVRASWVLRDVNRPDGSLFNGEAFHGNVFHGNLKEAVTQANGARVTVLVPSERILLAQVALPAMKGQRLARAVPFALEEQLADDVEDLHVAIGDRDTQGKVANAVVSRHTLESWLARLKAAGLHPDVMSPEVFGVHWDEDTEARKWSLIVNGSSALLRTGAQTGLAFDTENMNSVLQASLDEAGDLLPSSLNVVGCGEGLDDLIEGSAMLDALTALCAEHSVELLYSQADEARSVLLAQAFDESNAINLLQGDYSRKEQLGKLLRPWRAALILAAVWLLLQVGSFVADYSRLSSLADEQRAEIKSIFQKALPGSRLVPGSEKELMARALAKLKGGGGSNNGLLGLLAQAGEIIKETNGASLRSLRFKGNKLDVDMNLPDLQALDKFKQRLKQEAKLSVEIISASSRNGKVEARLSITGGGV